MSGARVIPAGAARVVPGVVADAKAEAARIVAGAEAVLDEARAAGRQAGLAETTELVARARAELARRAAAAEGELYALAVKIAEKILGRELRLAPEAVVDIVRGAVAAAAAQRQLTVRVHPDDEPAVRAAQAALAAPLPVRSALAVRADPDVPRGGCLVDTEVGTIDARLDVQLAAIAKALTGGAGGAKP